MSDRPPTLPVTPGEIAALIAHSLECHDFERADEIVALVLAQNDKAEESK